MTGTGITNSNENCIVTNVFDKYRATVSLGRSNCHLYHYAGNNPVRYTDPDGLFDVDFSTREIFAKLDSRRDLSMAATFYKYNQDFVFTATNNDGDSIVFNCYKNYKTFEKLSKGITLENVEDLISMLSTTTYIISEWGKTVEEFETVTKNIGNISTVLSAVSTSIDVKELMETPSTSNLLDVLSDFTSFIPTYGPIISSGITEMKLFSEAMGNMTEYMNIYLEDYFQNQIYNDFEY